MKYESHPYISLNRPPGTTYGFGKYSSPGAASSSGRRSPTFSIRRGRLSTFTWHFASSAFTSAGAVISAGTYSTGFSTTLMSFREWQSVIDRVSVSHAPWM